MKTVGEWCREIMTHVDGTAEWKSLDDTIRAIRREAVEECEKEVMKISASNYAHSFIPLSWPVDKVIAAIKAVAKEK